MRIVRIARALAFCLTFAGALCVRPTEARCQATIYYSISGFDSGSSSASGDEFTFVSNSVNNIDGNTSADIPCNLGALGTSPFAMVLSPEAYLYLEADGGPITEAQGAVSQSCGNATVTITITWDPWDPNPPNAVSLTYFTEIDAECQLGLVFDQVTESGSGSAYLSSSLGGVTNNLGTFTASFNGGGLAPGGSNTVIQYVTVTIPLINGVATINVPASWAMGASGSVACQPGGPYALFQGLTAMDLTVAVSEGPYRATLPSSPASLEACVIWTNDFTVSPNVLQASFDGGAVAGPSTVHIRFHPPAGYVPGTALVTSVTVDEVAQHYPLNTIGSNLQFGNSSANPGCNCGDPPDDNSYMYCDVPWPTNQSTASGYHSSTHNIAVQVTYSAVGLVNVGGPGCPGGGGLGGPSTISTTLAVTVSNDVITQTTPATSAPIMLTNTAHLPQSIPLTATITAADMASRRIVLEISPINDPTHPVWVNAQDQVVGGAGPPTVVTANWPGTTTLGDVLPKGLYLFKWKVTSPTIPNDDADTDKSVHLGVSIPSTGTPSMPRSTLVSDDGMNATYSVTYTITEDRGIPAAAGTINAYNTELALLPPQATATYTMAAGDLTVGGHTVTVTMPSPTSPVYVFLISLQDNEMDTDKGHRQRWKHIGASADLFAINFDFANYPMPPPLSTSPYADPTQPIAVDILSGAKWQNNAGFFMLPATYTNQTAAYARDMMMAKNDPLLRKPFIFSTFGHGGEGVAAQIVYQTFWTGTIWPTMTGNWSSVINVQGHNNTVYDPATWANLEWLGTLPDDHTSGVVHNPDPANPSPLGRMEMAMFIGCNDASGVVIVPTADHPDPGVSPSQMAVAKGAKYGTGFGQTIFETYTDVNGNVQPAATAWAEAFNHYLYTRTLNTNGTSRLVVNSINDAFRKALTAGGGPFALTGLTGFVVYYRGAGGTVQCDINQGLNMYVTLPLSPPKQN